MSTPYTDTDFFFSIDNQVRSIWAEAEVSQMLPVASKLLSYFDGIAVNKFPTEGYYYKTADLTKYFNLIRNFQSNEALVDRVLEEIKNGNKDVIDLVNSIKYVTDNDVFGPEEEADSPHKSRLLPRRRDMLSACLCSFNRTHTGPKPWTIDNILECLQDFRYGKPSLVELACLTNRLECIASAAETSILYREFGGYSGCAPPEYTWDVSKEVEDMGKALVDKYNELLKGVGSPKRMECPSPSSFDRRKFNWYGERPRICRLGIDYASNPPLNYYWAVNFYGGVCDFYRPEVVTTEMVQRTYSGLTEASPKFNASLADFIKEARRH